MRKNNQRNQPCPCGSGKKFKKCCWDLSDEEIELKQQANDTQMDDLMADYIKQQNEAAKKPSIEFNERLKTYLAGNDPIETLWALGALSLLPQNQAKEMRLVQIVQALLSNNASPSDSAIKDFPMLIEGFDASMGKTHEMMEIDNHEIVYISWIRFSGNVYRLFSSTLAESEVFFQSHIEKIMGLAKAVPTKLGSLGDALQWWLEKVDGFINDANLIQYESNIPDDYQTEKLEVVAKEHQALKEKLQKAFTLDKKKLLPAVHEMLAPISKPIGEYSLEFKATDTEFYQSPVIDTGDTYLIPFPQLVLPALINATHVLAATENTDGTVREAFSKFSDDKLHRTLKKFFSAKTIAHDVHIDGKSWANYCVNFDGKLLMIGLAVGLEGDDISKHLDAVGERLIAGYNELLTDPNKTVTADLGRLKIDEIVDNFEPVFIVLSDAASMNGVFGSSLSAEPHLLEAMLLDNFIYLLRDMKDPLKFIRFLRAMDRLRSQTRVMSIDLMDLYALYEGNEALQLREAEEPPTMLMPDTTGGARYVNRKIKKFRENRKIATIDGKRVILRRNWDHFYGETLSPGTLTLVRDDCAPSIRIDCSTKSSNQEESSSGYLVFDSLCYFLDQHIDTLEGLLGGITELQLKFTLNSSTDVITTAATSEKGICTVFFSIPPNAYELFAEGTNRGERESLLALLIALKAQEPQKLLDTIMPLSNQRNFQTKAYYLGHKSYEANVKPTTLSTGDLLWVDEVLSKALLAAGVKPGTYTGKKVGEVATTIKQVAIEELQKRLKKYSRREVINNAYAQLETIYVAGEKDMFQLQTSLDTSKDADTLDKGSIKEQDTTQLSFGTRYLLELTLKNEEEGDALLTDEAYIELLALAERVVDIDFWGDTIYYGLQPGELHVTKAGFPSLSNKGSEAAELNRTRILTRASSNRRASSAASATSTKGAAKTLQEKLEMLDDAAKKSFGFSLTERLTVTREALALFDDQSSPIMVITDKTLIDTLASKTKLAKEIVTKIIDDLKLTHGLLRDVDISPSERFWREEKISNKPFVALPGHENVLLVSRFLLENSVLIFHERLLCGRLEYIKNHPDDEFSKAVMDMVNTESEAFETAVIETAKQAGFQGEKAVRKLGKIPVPKNIGAIDGLLWDAKNGRAYVLEDKDSTVSRSPKEIKSEMDNYFGRDGDKSYYGQLEKNLTWVQENEGALREHFNIGDGQKIEIEGLLITNSTVAAAILKKPPYKTLRLRDLVTYLNSYS